MVLFLEQFAHHLSKQAAVQTGLASAIAEEVLSSIRTVFAFNGQKIEVERYSRPLAMARKIDIKKGYWQYKISIYNNNLNISSPFFC